MTFTEKVKEEISQQKLNEIENRNLLLGYIFINGIIDGDNNISIILENASVARKLFKTIKYCYHVTPKITVRKQKKFKVESIFILDINDKKQIIKQELINLYLETNNDKSSFIKGVFLASGSITNPSSNSYHLEINLQDEEKSEFLLNMLREQGYLFKLLRRSKNFMLYLKSGEQISDFLKYLEVVRELFYFEDIRIYRDHKNMVNRLNNCEQANFEKIINTSNDQVKTIKFIKENDFFELLDDKTKEVANYRLKYPEESYQSLANILSNALNKKVTKSYINHHLRKINEIYNRIK